MIPTVCKKCGSEKLVLLNKGVQKALYCAECLTYQKHLSKKEEELFLRLGGSYA